jgi:hypothetical protein
VGPNVSVNGSGHGAEYPEDRKEDPEEEEPSMTVAKRREPEPEEKRDVKDCQNHPKPGHQYPFLLCVEARPRPIASHHANRVIL